MRHRIYVIAAAIVASLASAALPAAAGAKSAAGPLVCNEAQSSWRGVYDTSISTDPNPPARSKTHAMLVGNGHGAGLANAAARSPALALCEPAPPPDDGGPGTT